MMVQFKQKNRRFSSLIKFNIVEYLWRLRGLLSKSHTGEFLSETIEEIIDEIGDIFHQGGSALKETKACEVPLENSKCENPETPLTAMELMIIAMFHYSRMLCRFLGGGGYRIPNVARCWTYETGLLLLDIEFHYYNFFGPDFSLHPKAVSKICQMLSEEPIFKTKMGSKCSIARTSGEFKSTLFDGINEEFRDAVENL
ncbi:unnamed protein product [Rhizophagus irregularis]|uniref:Uncharacterized protein n=1 Tax=Rhizophagus irregularis TaxID=588596 RepID=A0A915ZQ26_9GLOM|nr:unnamed protein product [Rhizophagus irregularis]